VSDTGAVPSPAPLSVLLSPRFFATRNALRRRPLRAWALGLLVGITILIIDSMRFEGVAPFIYYQF